MKLNRLFTPLLVIAAVLSCAKEPAGPDAKGGIDPAYRKGDVIPMGSPYVPGVASVKFDDAALSLIEGDLVAGRLVTKSMELNGALDELGIISMERTFPDGGRFEQRHRKAGLHRWYTITYDETISEEDAARVFSAMSLVSVYHPKVKVKTALTFNDPYESYQWGYNNTTSGSSWADINVTPVWQDYTTGSSDVIVAVVDGGIDYRHEDLSTSVIPGGPEGSQSFVNGYEGNIITPHSHGTHVAGTIGAINNNGKGLCGIAGGDAAKGIAGVKLLSCQIFYPTSKGDLGSSHSERAIVWAADHGAVICNNSWGGHYYDDNDNYLEKVAREDHEISIQPNEGIYATDFKDAVDYFNENAGMDENGNQVGPMAGGVVIFAAGNDNKPYGAPGCYPGCIQVGSINSRGVKSDFSNYGDWVDLAAPGSDIYSTIPTNDYTAYSGTSMACPHVSGVAALVVSYFGGPGFTREMLVEKLLKGANSSDLPASYKIGALVDALGAIAYGTGEGPDKIEDYTASSKANNLVFEITLPKDANGGPAYGVTMFASKDRSALESLNPMNPASGILTGTVINRDNTYKVGDKVEGSLYNGIEFNSTYYVTVAAFDYGHNYGEPADIKSVTTKANSAPVISTDFSGSTKIHSHESIEAVFSISDPDGHKVTVSFEPGSKAATWTDNSDGTFTLKVAGNGAREGAYTAVINATDEYDMKAAPYRFEYEILKNNPPVVKKPFEDVFFSLAGEQKNIDIEEYINDPDGEVLNYEISTSAEGVVHIHTSQNKLNLTALEEYGVATISISATDSGGEKAEGRFNVLIRPAGVQMQAYPNPVPPGATHLKVATGATPSESHITLTRDTGAKVYDVVTTCSAFAPHEIEVIDFAPGRYVLKVEFDGQEHKAVVIIRR